MFFLLAYLLIGLGLAAFVCKTDRGLRRDLSDATATLAGFLFLVVAWWVAFGLKIRNDSLRKRANRERAVYRAELRANELMRRDFDAWWLGLDLKIARMTSAR